MLNKTSLVILIIFQLTFLATAQATVIKPAPGNELSVSVILSRHINLDSLIRIDDGKDIVWGIGPGPESSTSIKVIGREAGFNNEFGFLSIKNGVVQDDFQSFGVSANSIGTTFEMNKPLSVNDDFLLAILTPEKNIFSSMPTYNSDAFDHMVTWVDKNDEFHYFVAFEDLLNGGDGDYNDIVIELHNFVDGPPGTIPEPFSLALFGLGLAGLGFVSGRRKVF